MQNIHLYNGDWRKKTELNISMFLQLWTLFEHIWTYKKKKKKKPYNTGRTYTAFFIYLLASVLCILITHK